MASESNDNQLKNSGLGKDPPFRAQSVVAGIYDTASPGIRAFLRKILASNQEAEDFLESVFLLAAERGRMGCEAAASADPMLETWVLLTARMQAVNRVREAVNEPPLNGPEISGGEWRVKAEEIRSLESRRNLLRRLIEQLPAEQRHLLDLVLFKGQTEEEIARATNEPLGRVRDQVRAAFAFVRQRVQTVMGTWTAGL